MEKLTELQMRLVADCLAARLVELRDTLDTGSLDFVRGEPDYSQIRDLLKMFLTLDVYYK